MILTKTYNKMRLIFNFAGTIILVIQITKCPKCRSTFNLQASLLSSTDGKVRCGACLAVFKANEHLIDAEVSYKPSDKESVFMSSDSLDYLNASDFFVLEELRNKDPEK